MRFKNTLTPKSKPKINKNLYDMVKSGAELFGDKALYLYDRNGTENVFTYNDLLLHVNAIGTALSAYGLFGGNVAIVGDTCPEYIASYLAVVNGNGVIVPLPKELSADNLADFIKLSECDAVIYTKAMNATFKSERALFDTVKYFIPIEPDDFTDERTLPYVSLLEKGKEMLDNGATVLTEHEIDMEKMCAIIFTSGTTGTSKGVMLNQRNLTTAANSAGQSMQYDDDNTFISFLPPYHTYEMSIGQFAIMNLGATIKINSSLKRTIHDMASFKPNALMLVPLFVETMHKRIWDEIDKRGMRKKVKAAMKASDAMLAMGIDMRQKLFGQITSAFGGNLKSIVCGGAAVNPEIIKDFHSFGILILEGYGITECSPLVSVNRPDGVRLKSVGTPVDGCTAKIDVGDDGKTGEILVKGDNVMLGYYKNPEATAEVFTEDGYFRTGDIGYMDEDGYIYITGRKKNVIILSNGKNVFPEEIEEYIYKIPEILEAVVIGRKDQNDVPRITAVCVPDMTKFEGVENEEIEARIRAAIAEMNKKLPIFKQVAITEIRWEEFEKTPSRKIKRYKVK
ncbi:MAG: AMP-binding protein [Clostridia bacterium]|nr:AMP-binding protein [Clostridia bacterium]